MSRRVPTAISGYAILVSAITTLHQQATGRAAAAVNQALVLRNWLIGQHIITFEQNGSDRARYGEQLLTRLGADLRRRGVSGASRQELGRYRLLSLAYPQLGDRIRPTVSVISRVAAKNKKRPTASVTSRPPILSADQLLTLSWSHLIELIRIKDSWKRAFYETQSITGSWSVRQLQRQIGSLLYERTGLSTDKAGLIAEVNTKAKAEPQSLAELIRDPYVLEFTGLAEKARYRESHLEQTLLDHLAAFLLELGTGFCLEARQKRITVGTEHDWIDLVFYHRVLRCHLLIDLKVRPFSHADAGQMNFYLNWWTANAMGDGDQPPVGLILCTAKDAVKVEYATAGLDRQLFVSRYLVALPKVADLQRLIETDQAHLAQIRPPGKRTP